MRAVGAAAGEAVASPEPDYSQAASAQISNMTRKRTDGASRTSSKGCWDEKADSPLNEPGIASKSETG
jgi:hypothetical protein